jgi:deoxycytidine triphosphate deaminase
MSLLSRDEIIDLFKSGDLKVEHSNFEDWVDQDYSWKSPFQQCSIDLKVGSVYVPETDSDQRGGANDPIMDEHILKPGHTVMVRTKEKLSLPTDVGGLCFSPSRLALKAILVTNMGHVDPGYSGHLHFAAINMGKEAYALRTTDVICTMTLFKLNNKVPAFGDEYFVEKKGVKYPVVISNYFPKLSRDFVDVENRAKKVAKNEIDRTKFYQIGVPIISAIIIAGIPLCQLWINKPWEKNIGLLEEKIKVMETRSELAERIDSLEDQLKQYHKKEVDKNGKK